VHVRRSGGPRASPRGVSKLGGQDWTPLSYNPKLGYVYYCEKVSVEAAKIGSVKEGGTFHRRDEGCGWQRRGGQRVRTTTSSGVSSRWLLEAAATGKRCHFQAVSCSQSANRGMLYAFDARTGAKLWSYKAP